MEEPEDSDARDEPGYDWRKVKWKLWLSRVLVGGIVLWLVAGAVRIILQDFFVSPGGYTFYPNAFTGQSIVRITSWSFVIETVAFRAWLGSAVLLGFLWLRNRPDWSN